jgi:hypothetical protein
MPERKKTKLSEEIKRLAEYFDGSDSHQSRDELRAEIASTGLDPEALRERLHEIAKQLARKERAANRPAPPLLLQAIDSTRAPHDIPQDADRAGIAADRWIQTFLAPFKAPRDLSIVKAYRTSDEITPADKRDLDELEGELKRKVERDSERGD